jgi:2-oxoglutarate dehydrogenase E2 component (dihydrolipoamide succinyltransferase)
MPVVKVVVPNLGDSVTEARLAKWLVPDGSAVKRDTPIAELETDKVSQPIYAAIAGVLKTGVAAGADVKSGQELGELNSDGAATAPAPTEAPPAAAAPVAAGEPKVSPAAARILNEKGVDAGSVPATGPKGTITKDDALAAKPLAVPQPQTPLPPAPLATANVPTVAVNNSGREQRQNMSMIRRRIAERLLESQNTTATLTTFNEADMTAIQELRAKYNERFEKKHGVKIGFMSVFVKAAIEALKSFPVVNARIEGNDIVYQNFYDISVAVSTEKGLTVPVIRDADALGFADIEKRIAELAKKARDSKLTPQDMLGGTFTITNGGIFGSMLSTPILNPPQTAILGMHAIQKRAVVVNDEIVIRPMMYLALSYDHRLIDGREAVQFLVRIKECLEDPERILFGV